MLLQHDASVDHLPYYRAFNRANSMVCAKCRAAVLEANHLDGSPIDLIADPGGPFVITAHNGRTQWVEIYGGQDAETLRWRQHRCAPAMRETSDDRR